MLKQHRSLKYSMRLFTCRSFTTRERFRHANKKISTCKQNGQNSIMHNLIYAGYGRWIEATLPKNQSKKLKMHDTHISFPGAWRVVVIAQKHPTFRHAQIKMVRTAFQKLGIKGQVRRGGERQKGITCEGQRKLRARARLTIRAGNLRIFCDGHHVAKNIWDNSCHQ